MSMRLGFGIGPVPCSEGTTRKYVSESEFPVAFMDSPYGFTTGYLGGSTLIPYLIDEPTLEIEYRPDLAIADPEASSSRNSNSRDPCVMDDSTMVFQGTPTVGTSPNFNIPLYVLTRSGLAVSLSGPQQSVSTGSVAMSVVRVDATHIVVTGELPRTTPGFPVGLRIRTLSVSGGTLSLVSTTTITTNPVVSDDAGGPNRAIHPFQIYPIHYSGGLLYAFTFATPSGAAAIVAIPYTPGGGITGGTIGLSTRCRVAGFASGSVIAAATIGSSECVLYTTTGYRAGFYDDGSDMIAPGLTLSSPAARAYWTSMGYIGYQGIFEGTRAQPFGNFLTPGGLTDVDDSGSLIGPSIMTQSGATLSFSPVTLEFLCPQFGTDLVQTSARHGANLGAQMIRDPYDLDPFVSPFNNLLRAYRW